MSLPLNPSSYSWALKVGHNKAFLLESESSDGEGAHTRQMNGSVDSVKERQCASLSSIVRLIQTEEKIQRAVLSMGLFILSRGGRFTWTSNTDGRLPQVTTSNCSFVQLFTLGNTANEHIFYYLAREMVIITQYK